jgi:hypothetical protein
VEGQPVLGADVKSCKMCRFSGHFLAGPRRGGNSWGYGQGAPRQPNGAWRPLGGASVRRSAGCSLSLERNLMSNGTRLQRAIRPRPSTSSAARTAPVLLRLPLHHRRASRADRSEWQRRVTATTKVRFGSACVFEFTAVARAVSHSVPTPAIGLSVRWLDGDALHEQAQPQAIHH